jgi:hypothetical protein
MLPDVGNKQVLDTSNLQKKYLSVHASMRPCYQALMPVSHSYLLKFALFGLGGLDFGKV